MKKRTVSAFTLVEMLIVIVIIGILIAALMPRMQAAQWRARDVSRKTALSQVQSAIVTSQWDKWKWPWQSEDNDCATDCAQVWMWLSAISWDLTTAWMSSVPIDPLKTEELEWLWNFTGTPEWDYGYMITKRNWTLNWWFVLMAKTEVEWWSNWVVCDSEGVTKDLTHWRIWASNAEDIVDIHPCTTFKKDDSETVTCKIENGECYYDTDNQLRYILLY